MRKKKLGRPLDAARLAADIRSELRLTFRGLQRLHEPISRFHHWPARAEPPRYFVEFRPAKHRDITGLKVRVGCLSVPDEPLLDEFYQLAGILWHLKDRLSKWTKASSVAFDAEAYVQTCPALLVCADLVNWKKHGEHRNRSGANPILGIVSVDRETGARHEGIGMVSFDTSLNGLVEFYYEGATKEKELLVEKPIPIPYRVDVVSAGRAMVIDDARSILTRALCHWMPCVEKLGLLSGADLECESIRQNANRLRAQVANSKPAVAS